MHTTDSTLEPAGICDDQSATWRTVFVDGDFPPFVIVEGSSEGGSSEGSGTGGGLRLTLVAQPGTPADKLDAVRQAVERQIAADRPTSG